ncbi:MAG: quinolinate synthase NadA [Ignavibacteria bacterium]|nr:MAG: quinolinate synthase NadA [Ignavibacteria bacterium]
MPYETADIAPQEVAETAFIPLNLEDEILRLKRDLNSEIQDLADFVGDSLELSRRAASTDRDVIVFAGVHFMAETAKILNPRKQVLLPDLNAGCSLAEGCPAPLFKAFREMHPHHVAITYINCSAEVKALSDIICTSSNAEKIIRQVPEDRPILFAPDRNLGKYLVKKTGREMLLWQGSCIVHETFSERKLLRLRAKYPRATLIAHPECDEAVLEKAEFVGSTSALLRYVQQSAEEEFIIATEAGIIHQMEKSCPGKVFIPAPPEESCACNLCPYMKLNTMEKLYLCMKNRSPEISMSDDLIGRAYKPIRETEESGSQIFPDL